MSIATNIAVEQAIQLYHQKAKYEDIAKHLQKIGYVSERTKKPVGAQAVRLMILHALKLRGEDAERPGASATDSPAPVEKSSTIQVVRDQSPKGDLLHAIRQVVGLDVSSDTKVKMVAALLS